MNNVEQLREMISKTTVKPEYHHLMAQLVHAETFHMNRMNNILYDFSVEDREDGRSWLTVDVYVETDELNMYTCRPFVDQSSRIKREGKSFKVSKTYFLYGPQQSV